MPGIGPARLAELVELDPRVRATLPMQAIIATHDNGLSAQLMLPVRMWTTFRNPALSRAAWKLQQQLVEGLHRVSAASNV